MVRSFNNFKASVTFAVKNFEYAYISPENCFDYISPENFFDLPPVDNISVKNFYDLVKILGKVGQNMTTPPPPPPPMLPLRDVPDCCIGG